MDEGARAILVRAPKVPYGREFPFGRRSLTDPLEFVLHGVPYACPGELGPECRGVPTAHSAPPLEGWVSDAEPVVWPHIDGERRGASLAPLCHNAPSIVGSNPELYRWLTLVDALRIGRARERSRARELLEEELLAWTVS